MASILPILSIVGAVKRRKQQKEVKRELALARDERQQAAEERRQMQEELQAQRANANGGNVYPQAYGSGEGYPYASAGSPYAETGGYYAPSPAQPLGGPVAGVPMQMPSPASPAYYGGAQPVALAGPVVYCKRCEANHAPPTCHSPTRRERREERREDRRERREERRERRQDRRESFVNMFRGA